MLNEQSPDEHPELHRDILEHAGLGWRQPGNPERAERVRFRRRAVMASAGGREAVCAARLFEDGSIRRRLRKDDNGGRNER